MFCLTYNILSPCRYWYLEQSNMCRPGAFCKIFCSWRLFGSAKGYSCVHWRLQRESWGPWRYVLFIHRFAYYLFSSFLHFPDTWFLWVHLRYLALRENLSRSHSSRMGFSVRRSNMELQKVNSRAPLTLLLLKKGGNSLIFGILVHSKELCAKKRTLKAVTSFQVSNNPSLLEISMMDD